jgi:nickel/cobalt transporter (NiCoT) family protein
MCSIIALVIETVELLRVFIRLLGLEGPFFDYVPGLGFGILGYAIVGTFLAAWAVSVVVWKSGATKSATDTSSSAFSSA